MERGSYCLSACFPAVYCYNDSKDSPSCIFSQERRNTWKTEKNKAAAKLIRFETQR